MTFEDLQNSVLRWMDEEGDTGTVLENVKFALNEANKQRTLEHEWTWRLSAEQTQALSAGVKTYSLPADYGTMLYVMDRGNNVQLRSIPTSELLEVFPNGEWSTASTPDAFIIRGTTLELLFTPSGSESLVYRYFISPTEMTADDDEPDLPANHHGLLVWDALLDLKGYHAETEMINMFLDRQQRALHGLYQEHGFDGADVLGARQTKVKYRYDEGM
jgi:hypothetical protein